MLKKLPRFATTINDQAEIDLLSTIEEFVGERLDRTDHWFIIDFEGERVCAELKTRTVTRDRYQTTMIGENKISYLLEMSQTGKNCYVFFQFSDGLFSIEINDATVSTFTRHQRGGRRDRGYNEIKDSGYCYIPTSMLIVVPAKTEPEPQKDDDTIHKQ
tara:strand:- start:1046 stop:1522 length:477 start_codon:yes stop_codon:yes gene_type:complete